LRAVQIDKREWPPKAWGSLRRKTEYRAAFIGGVFDLDPVVTLRGAPAISAPEGREAQGNSPAARESRSALASQPFSHKYLDDLERRHRGSTERTATMTPYDEDPEHAGLLGDLYGDGEPTGAGHENAPSASQDTEGAIQNGRAGGQATKANHSECFGA
jgi:hypothetical protein